MKRESFSTQERIRKKKDFDRLYQGGSRLYSKNFTVLLSRPSGIFSNSDSAFTSCETSSQLRRLGITASKKVGNAVVRNRFKRLLREFFRRNKDKLPPASDILIIVRKNAATLSYRDVYAELGGLLFGTVRD